MIGSRWLRHPHAAVLIFLVVSLLWGSAFPAIKRSYVLLEIGPDTGLFATLLFAGVRFLIAGVLLIAGAAIFRLVFIVSRRQLRMLFLLGVVQTTLLYTTFYLGMVFSTGVKASIINASGSFFLAGVSPFIFPNDRLTRWTVVGLFLGFTGVVLASLSRTGTEDVTIQWLGDGLILATGLCSTLASLMSKKLVQDLHPVVVNGYQVTLGSLLLLAIAIPNVEVRHVVIGAEIIVLTLYLSSVTAIAFTLYYLVLKHHELSRVAAYRFMIPLCGIAMSAAFIPGESLQWPLVVAAIFVALGIWAVNQR